MDAAFDRLLDAIPTAFDTPPGDLAAALAKLPEVGHLPSPWTTWTLVVLGRLVGRQALAEALLREHLLDGDPSRDAFHDEGGPPDGPLPGMPGWGYEMDNEGRYCTLTRTAGGEAVTVAISGREFGHFVFLRFLDQLGPCGPETPEGRVRSLHPSSKTVALALDDLRAAGLLDKLKLSPFARRRLTWRPPWRQAQAMYLLTAASGGKVETFPSRALAYRLTPPARALSGRLAAFGEAWALATGADRVWAAAAIGDWPGAHEAALAAGDPAVIARTEERLEQCRSGRAARIGAELAGGSWPRDIPLEALREAGADEFPGRLRSALAGAGVDAAEAMAVVDGIDDPSWCPEVLALYNWVMVDGGGGDVDLAANCARFLVRHDHHKAAMLASLAGTLGRPDEAALLALEYAPECALTAVRHALRASPPLWTLPRGIVPAALALIGRPWCRRELTAFIRESDDRDRTMFARAALRRDPDPDARRAVELWEEEHPLDVPEDVLKFRSATSHPDECLIRLTDRLRDRVIPLRDRTPGSAPLAGLTPTGLGPQAG